MISQQLFMMFPEKRIQTFGSNISKRFIPRSDLCVTYTPLEKLKNVCFSILYFKLYLMES